MPFGRASFFRMLLAVIWLAGFWTPVEAEVYTWRDQDGVLNATNSRDRVPAGVKAEVFQESPGTPASDSQPAPETKAPPPAKIPKRAATLKEKRSTEGAFAVRLVGELGLGKRLPPEEAADLLTEIRVAPPLGRWRLDDPITPALAARLRALTVAAARRGAISIERPEAERRIERPEAERLMEPEEALFAFDTAAALLNVPVSARAEAELSDPAYSSTLVEPPPAVLAAPPQDEEILSSTVWVPFEPGFFCNCSGFDRFNPFPGRRFHRGFRSFARGGPIFEPAPPSATILTPLAPRRGFAISPLAPPFRLQ